MTNTFEVGRTDKEWHRLLTPEQYRIMRGHGMEAPGSCALNDEKPRRRLRLRGMLRT